MIEWRFGVAGNIKHSHKDENGNVLYGTKEFAGGTKVYIDGKNWSKNGEIRVIGRNKFNRYVFASVEPALIENVRFKIIRKAVILKKLSDIEFFEGWIWWGRLAKDKKEAIEFVNYWKEKVVANDGLY